MLSLQVYVPHAALADVLVLIQGQPGVNHLVRVGISGPGSLNLLTADIEARAVDTLLPLLVAAGVSGEEIAILHTDGSRPLAASRPGDLPSWGGGALAWMELAKSSLPYARAAPQYLVYMTCAGIIAVFGVLTRNIILIIGAMAVSPDLLPLCAVCVGLVSRRRRLAGRAFAALIAGILAFETKSSAAVGVAISITTIPAAAFGGAEAAIGDWVGAGDALAVLSANITMLVLAGTLTPPYPTHPHLGRSALSSCRSLRSPVASPSPDDRNTGRAITR